MPENNYIANLRKDYSLRSLSETDVNNNPIEQFKTWWNEAIESEIAEPNAMTLATCSREGKPSARIVLLKGINENGLIFYTNYNSRKGKEMEENSFVSLVFLWKEIERQVRVEGKVKKISEEESDVYFSSRPIKSQLGAWSSHQSKVIENRQILEKSMEDYTSKFLNEIIPRPKYWGGYIVQPELIEFWQGRRSRLHDRIQYTLTDTASWKIERLSP